MAITYKPYEKTSETAFDEVKLPYSVLADAPDLSEYVTKSGADTISGVKTFTSAPKMDTLENSRGNAVYHFNGTCAYFGQTTFPVCLRGNEIRPKYLQSGEATASPLALYDDLDNYVPTQSGDGTYYSQVENENGEVVLRSFKNGDTVDTSSVKAKKDGTVVLQGTADRPKYQKGGNTAVDIALKSDISTITVDSALSSTSTNPVQNKVINSALASKQNTLTAGANITISGNTISATDTNTTYTFASGDNNGTIKVTPSGGTAQNVAVKGLGSAAYTASTAYATSAQGTKADNAVPNTRKVNGKALSADITLSASDVGALASGTTYVSSVNGASGAVTDVAKTNASNTFMGNQSVTGNLTVGGNLVVNGSNTTVNSNTLAVKDKLIEVASGNTVALTTPAGLVAPKYDGTNSGAMVFDASGTAYVGDVVLDSSGNIVVASSSLQPLATRSAESALTNGHLMQWDSTNKKLVDSGLATSAVLTSHQDISGKQDKLTAGTNITISGSTISAKDTTYSVATTSANGLMSASDKTKLDGIASGANKTTVDTAMSSTSTNPVQNKVVNSAISAKYTKPSGGIPKADLASDVQTSLGKADSALQSHQSLANYVTLDGTQNITGAKTFASNVKAPNFNSRFALQSVPYGTPIGSNVNLNTTTYLRVGNYYCSSDAAVKTLTNCPTSSAFMMTVYSPLTTTVDNETTSTWVYRVRKLMTYGGDEFIQMVNSGSTAGTFTYGAWKKIAKTTDIPTNYVTTNTDQYGIAGEKEFADGVFVEGGLYLSSALWASESAGTSGQVLTSQGAGATPKWSDAPKIVNISLDEGEIEQLTSGGKGCFYIRIVGRSLSDLLQIIDAEQTVLFEWSERDLFDDASFTLEIVRSYNSSLVYATLDVQGKRYYETYNYSDVEIQPLYVGSMSEGYSVNMNGVAVVFEEIR